MGRQHLLPSDQRNQELLKCQAVAAAINKLVAAQIGVAIADALVDKAEVMNAVPGLASSVAIAKRSLSGLQQDISFALDEAVRVYIEGDTP